jgi:hypothetical protein
MHGSNLEPHENFPSDEKLRERVEELSESVMIMLWVVFDFTFFFFLKRPLYCRLEIQIRPHGSPMLHFCTRLVSLPPVMSFSSFIHARLGDPPSSDTTLGGCGFQRHFWRGTARACKTSSGVIKPSLTHSIPHSDDVKLISCITVVKRSVS